MKLKRTVHARKRASAVPKDRPRPIAPPAPPLDRAVAKKLLELWKLPKEEQPKAFTAWLKSAGTPKRITERQKKVVQLLDYASAEVKKMTPRRRAAARAEGIAMLGKASRALPAKSKR